MAKIQLTLRLRKKGWVSPFLEFGAFACAVTALISWPAANWLSDRLTSFVAKRGFRIEAC